MAKIWIIGGTTETFETAEKLGRICKIFALSFAKKYG